jgi:tripartite motif-containing protein 71
VTSDIEPASASEEPLVEEEPTRGFYLTPRQAFGCMAAALALLLVALLLYLLYFLQPKNLGSTGGETSEGIEPLMAIEGPGVGTHPAFDRPQGAAFDNQGRIWVSDTGNDRLVVFGSDGRFLFELGGFGVAKPAPGGTFSWKEGRLNFPLGIAIDELGNAYVADFRNDQIQVFDESGRFVRRFPDNRKRTGKGSSGQDGAGIAVTAVAVRGDEVYATDTYQVFVFSKDGTLLRQFGKPGRGPGDLDHPNGVAAADDGTVYVSDSNHSRVIAFSPEGKPKWSVGRIPASMNDTSTGDLDLPRGLAVLGNGDILVVDTFSFELVRISKDGKVLARYGARGVDPGQFNFPNSVSVLGDRLLVSDKENNRVQVLRLVKR